jgi:hypothetical protein
MDDGLNLGGAQLGEMSAGDIAQTIYNVSSEQAIRMLADEVAALTGRLQVLERAELQHTNERQAMTRLITMLASESRTVSDVLELIQGQIASEGAEREQRRRYLDTMLTSLVVLAFINLGMHIMSRVFRRPRRAA